MNGQLKLLTVKISNTQAVARPINIDEEIPILYNVLCPHCGEIIEFSIHDIIYDNNDIGTIECNTGKCKKLNIKKVPIIHIKRQQPVQEIKISSESFVNPIIMHKISISDAKLIKEG